MLFISTLPFVIGFYIYHQLRRSPDFNFVFETISTLLILIGSFFSNYYFYWEDILTHEVREFSIGILFLISIVFLPMILSMKDDIFIQNEIIQPETFVDINNFINNDIENIVSDTQKKLDYLSENLNTKLKNKSLGEIKSLIKVLGDIEDSIYLLRTRNKQHDELMFKIEEQRKELPLMMKDLKL